MNHTIEIIIKNGSKMVSEVKSLPQSFIPGAQNKVHHLQAIFHQNLLHFEFNFDQNAYMKDMSQISKKTSNIPT